MAPTPYQRPIFLNDEFPLVYLPAPHLFATDTVQGNVVQVIDKEMPF